MRLTFICGSLEPGLDGVGDYVRRLSGTLLNSGHTINAVAFHDQYVDETLTGYQDAEGANLGVLRLPSDLPSIDKMRLASGYIEQINPEIISLQFVPYAFHKKGFPFLFHRSMQGLVRNRRLHILFHEIWLDSPAGLKQKIAAVIQRRLICKLVKILRPESINVSAPFEKSQLEQAGIHSEVLSLFGNIYPAEEPGSIKNLVEHSSGMYSSLLYFGAPPKGMFKEILFSKLNEFCKRSKSRIRLILVCGDSASKEEFCASMGQMLAGYNCEIEDYGFLAAADISKLMLECQVGISKSKPHFLSKSGAAMAMLEHGLPLWLPRWNGGDTLSGEFRKQLVFADLDRAIYSEKLDYYPLINKVTAQFTETLTRL